MSERISDGLFLDSEASLRLVDHALTDLRVSRGQSPGPTAAGGGEPNTSGSDLVDLPAMLLRAYTEINGVLHNLRRGRDVLQQAAWASLQQTNRGLLGESSAKRPAASEMLDGLDRALVMIDELDAETSGTAPTGAALRKNLRKELFRLSQFLQRQDVAAQHLNAASSVLDDVEQRLTELARIFGPDRLSFQCGAPRRVSDRLTADSEATPADAERRQILVDELFAVG